MAKIDRQFLETPFYGARQMTWYLKAEGHAVNVKRVRRLMRQMGLMPIYRQPRTSIPANAHKLYPYLLRGARIDDIVLKDYRETVNPNSPLVRVLERSISWVAWGAMVLWVSGLLPLMLGEAGIAWRGEGAVVVDAPAPIAAPTLFWPGPTLAEALRDMNKPSSNLVAQQVLLSVARAAGVPAPSPETAAAWLQAWLDTHAGTTPPTRMVNGSGLARETRLSPAQLASLLRWAWGQPWMPELLASLPVAGLDGTLSRQPGRFGAATGRAHLKTGSLRDVVALAGIVDAPSGRRWVLVAIVNHPQAQAGRGVLDALLRWVAQDAPPAR